MSFRDSGHFGVVIAVGGAFAIPTFYADNPVFAAVLAVATVITAAVVYFKVDKPARQQSRS
jgi:peptidoglycan/LPS O-acetylase OafA/YrhL